MKYKIIRSKRRTVALQVNSDATLTVRIPYGISMEYVERFIADKRSWIEKKQEKFRTLGIKHKPKQFSEGEEFIFAGKPYPLEVVPGIAARISLSPDGKLRITKKCLEAPKHYIEWFYKQYAKKHLTNRLAELARTFGYKCNSVKINSAKTRWGSCSAKGNINFSWKLVILPSEMIDYVIVHELVHLEIKDHSTRFYARMSELMPDHRQREKWLKENSAMTKILIAR
ncbi:MAG: M48 family metallopeptidase [Ignavibacteria bacterium]|nr:M48 family metallopeptidase [Ignavibacteria bacterium]